MTRVPEPSDAELLQRLHHSLRALPDVPAWASERALAAWAARPAPATLGGRLSALLRFDSWQLAPQLATRGAAPSEQRQLLFAVGEHDLDLRVVPQEGAPARYALFGQLLGPDADARVRWRRQGDDAASGAAQPLDELGEFELRDLPAGDGWLELEIDGQAVTLPPLLLGPAGAVPD